MNFYFKGIAINVTTLESAVYGFAHADELKSLRKSLYPEPLPKPKYRLNKRYSHENQIATWFLMVETCNAYALKIINRLLGV